jgi:LacI family transcriptional regulator
MSPSRRKVALLIETSNSYGRDLLYGIRAWMRENESWIIRMSEQGRGADVPGWLRRWPGDGIIARVENEAIARALEATRLPVVDVSAALPGLVFPRVSTDSDAASRLAVEHLVSRGFKHFAYCGDPRFFWSVQRANYFAAQVRAAGFDCSHYAPAISQSGQTRTVETEVKEIARWLRTLPKPAGVHACYDIRGQQVLEACQDAGLLVPDEVAVIGVHNDELLCDLCEPPLTSVIPNARKAGYVAAGLLAQMMNGRPVPARTHPIEPIGVAARQSTDVVAVPDANLSAAVRFVREHALENIGVGDVLRAVPMSRTLLERKFKQFLGCTPHEHIQRARFERVKDLLVTTDLPVSTVAERTGFEHTEYLSVAFRRAIGLTPKEYRSRHRAAAGAPPGVTAHAMPEDAEVGRRGDGETRRRGAVVG